MVQRVIRRVGKDKMVKDELRAWEWQDYPGRGTGDTGRWMGSRLGGATFMTLASKWKEDVNWARSH